MYLIIFKSIKNLSGHVQVVVLEHINIKLVKIHAIDVHLVVFPHLDQHFVHA